MNSKNLPIPKNVHRNLVWTTVIGIAILAITAIVSPDRAWANLLLVAYYLVTLGLGGALFIALTTVTSAGWSTSFRRVPEAMTGLLPIAGVALLAVIAIGLQRYGWHHHGEGDAGTFWFKEFWLQPRFLFARAVVYILLWVAFAKLLVSNSLRQDKLLSTSNKQINLLPSVLFIFIFAATITLAGIDWIMALEPLWFSTMWGVYQFAGLMMGTFSVIIIACILLRRMGVLEGVFRDEHLHDLGKLQFGFSCFWMYIWFSQYMLIWYSNIPEETSYFSLRTVGAWGPIVIGAILLNWIIPFFTLLPRPSKRSESIMLKIAVVILLGRWVDLYIMIFPPITGKSPVFGFPEVATIACLVGISGLVFIRSFVATNPVPQNDPFLKESLSYHC